MTMDTKKVIAVAAVCVALLQIGNFTDKAGHAIGAIDTAYAAKDQAQKVDDKFQSYLDSQKAVAEALTNYVKNEQQRATAQAAPAPQPIQTQQQIPFYQQSPPPPPIGVQPKSWIVNDPNGAAYCTDGKKSWWPNPEGKCE